MTNVEGVLNKDKALIQEISSSKLIKCINKFYKLNRDKFKLETKLIENCSIDNIDNILKEFYKRFIIPFYIPSLMLTILFLLLKSKESINYFNYRIFIFLFGLSLIISSEMSLRFIKNDIFENIKLFIIPVILMTLIYSTIFFNLNSYKKK